MPSSKSVKKNILEFWDLFEKEAPQLLKALENQEYPALAASMEQLDNLCYKISGAHFFIEDNLDYPEMTFDTGPNKTTQLICAEMKKLAPSSVKEKWIINEQLAPLSQKAIEAQISIKDQVYTLADFTCFYQIDKATESFVVDLYCSGFHFIENPEHKREMCIYLVELAVGLKFLEAYISRIDFTDSPKEEMKICNLTELYDIIEQTVIKEHWKEYKSSLDIHSVYEPNQEIVHDALRKDMKIIHTIHPTLTEENLAGMHDSLKDLQDKGGEFAYIYFLNLYDGKESALFRQELSRQLSALLAPLHCARVIGGAIGKAYSYIDLIVFEPRVFQKVFDQIQSQLKGKIDIYYRLFSEDSR